MIVPAAAPEHAVQTRRALLSLIVFVSAAIVSAADKHHDDCSAIINTIIVSAADTHHGYKQ
jgi:hypothetical protein